MFFEQNWSSFISNFIEASFNFSLNNIIIINEEWWLFLISVIIGLVSCLIPSIQVYKMIFQKYYQMNKLLNLFFLLISFSVFSQIKTDWIELRDVHYKSQYNEEFDSYFQVPFFGKMLKH